MPRKKVIIEPRLIIETAFELIDREGFTRFSSRNLASKLGVSHMTIYNYFSREEILHAAIDHGFQILHNDMDSRIQAHIESRAHAVEIYKIAAESMLVFAGQHKHIYRFMFGKELKGNQLPAEISSRYQGMEKIMKPLLSEDIYSDFRKDSSLFLRLINSIILTYIDGGYEKTEESCREDIARSFDKLLGCYLDISL